MTSAKRTPSSVRGIRPERLGISGGFTLKSMKWLLALGLLFLSTAFSQPSQLPFLSTTMSSNQRATAMTLFPMAEAVLRGQKIGVPLPKSPCRTGTERLGFLHNSPAAYQKFKQALLRQGYSRVRETREDILTAFELSDKSGATQVMGAWLSSLSGNTSTLVLCQRNRPRP